MDGSDAKIGQIFVEGRPTRGSYNVFAATTVIVAA